ncbi:MAG: serine/threonine-protein phosphatase, partial [Chloroflexi bacterium]|nr:serine/threonine-protein phosphatase [Chloroflexota bacterium]
MEQPIVLDVGRRTERGRAREFNEDFLGTPEDMGIDPSLVAQKGRLYAVCDGMGGHAAGEAASRLAVQTLFTAYYAAPSPNVQESLRQAVAQANAAVYAAAQADPAKQGMGSTVVAPVLQGDQVTIASVGDSRAYLVNRGGIGQITTDHTWVQEQVAAGVLTPEQARRHLYRSRLTRALGGKPEVQADLFQERIAPGEA